MSSLTDFSTYESAIEQEIFSTVPRDPFGQVMADEKLRLFRSVEQVKRHAYFVQRYYRDPLNRVLNNYLDQVEPKLKYNWYFQLSSYSTLQLQLYPTSIKEVIPVIKCLVGEGMKLLKAPKPGGTSSYRTWTFQPRDVDPDDLGIILTLDLVACATRCKQVQVGVREVPIMETVCEWDDDPQVTDTPEAEVTF